MNILKLKRKEITFLKKFTRKGQQSARTFARANILLSLHEGETGEQIADKFHLHLNTVYNIKRKYLSEGLDAALSEKPRTGQPRKYDDKKRTEIVAYACTNPPQGRKRWTVRLLAEELCKQKGFETINRETIRLVLKKTKPNLG